MIPDKSIKLKSLLTQKESLDFLMEAHNGLSAKIAESAGFKGLWGSGLSIASSLGLRDCNEASWTQVLDILEYMADAVDIPILMDGDSGYGNFNNVRRLIKKLEQRNISGVCIEDKQFPKLNSFIGEGQGLSSVSEFCGKIKAAKDTQINQNFCVVARIEALICGFPVDIAIERAIAYYEVGADAILIHSKKSSADEILDFCKQCPPEIPLVIVPTKYFKTPTSVFRDANISTVIWANHSLRASYSAIEKLTHHLKQSESLVDIENEIVSLSSLFDFLNYDELEAAEKRYLYREL